MNKLIFSTDSATALAITNKLDEQRCEYEICFMPCPDSIVINTRDNVEVKELLLQAQKQNSIILSISCDIASKIVEWYGKIVFIEKEDNYKLIEIIKSMS